MGRYKTGKKMERSVQLRFFDHQIQRIEFNRRKTNSPNNSVFVREAVMFYCDIIEGRKEIDEKIEAGPFIRAVGKAVHDLVVGRSNG